MDQNLPKGSSPEITPGGAQDEPGVYRHPGAKKEVITVPGEKGVIQANALTRLGFVRIGPVPSRIELKKMQDAQLHKDRLLDAKERAAEKAATEAADAEIAQAAADVKTAKAEKAAE